MHLRLSDGGESRFKQLGEKSAALFETPFLGDLIPWLSWLDVQGAQKRMDRVAKGFDTFLEKKEVQEFMKGVDAFAGILFKAIFESLGLEEYAEKEVPSGTIPRVRMSINYYPPCPDPNLTLGLSPHSDVGSLTVLHPGVVPGLEIKHKQTWIPVIPADPSAFVINVADQIEIWTNGKYKSIEHRVVTNTKKPRMSFACFYGPLDETVVAPLPTLVDENHPPRFKPTKFEDYLKNFASNRLLANRGFLDLARV
ncbi:hypothetical protein L7F22_044748 [Adiantum nelumboides]|nr:hypothetical protein [Adiantum nelumboides]